jgi:hypothetical protein
MNQSIIKSITPFKKGALTIFIYYLILCFILFLFSKYEMYQSEKQRIINKDSFIICEFPLVIMLAICFFYFSIFVFLKNFVFGVFNGLKSDKGGLLVHFLILGIAVIYWNYL